MVWKLTLKATGSEWLFLSLSVCVTSCWKGPVPASASPKYTKVQRKLTLEAQLRRVEFDRHGVAWAGAGVGVACAVELVINK
jgi:hypothetical protein